MFKLKKKGIVQKKFKKRLQFIFLNVTIIYSLTKKKRSNILYIFLFGCQQILAKKKVAKIKEIQYYEH